MKKFLIDFKKNKEIEPKEKYIIYMIIYDI